MTKDEKVTLGELFRKLYGHNGYRGDIPRILKHIEDHTEHFDDHSRRLTIAETQIKERTLSKMSKKAIVGYSGGGTLVLTITILQILQMLNG